MLYEGDFSSPAGRFALVAARFNSFIVDQLVAGATDALHRHGVADDRIDLVRVPGSYEIPLVAQKLGKTGKYDGGDCLGCVIQRRYLTITTTSRVLPRAGSHASRCSIAAFQVIFGVLTCDTLEQAIHRAGAKAGNKGFEAAVAAIEMVNLLKKLP